MLAVAGCIIQRLTGNPMASPEVLGISSGAAFGVVLMLFLVPETLHRTSRLYVGSTPAEQQAETAAKPG